MRSQVVNDETGLNSEDGLASIDESRRRFLLTTTSIVGGVGAVCALTPLLSSWLPSAKAKANSAPVTVDLSALAPGQQLTVEWRGKPVWIVRRTPKMLQHLNQHNDALRDPNSFVDQQPIDARNPYRSLKPEYLVLIGVCTHLGCIPKYKPYEEELGPDWPGGFYCPCHGSSFDLAGRVFKNVPAPINLAVPPHRYLNDHTILIGEANAS